MLATTCKKVFKFNKDNFKVASQGLHLYLHENRKPFYLRNNMPSMFTFNITSWFLTNFKDVFERNITSRFCLHEKENKHLCFLNYKFLNYKLF